MKKLAPPRIGAAVTGAVRSALERVRVRGNGKPAPAPRAPSRPSPREPDHPLDLAEERAASRDLLAIDGLVRRFYAHAPATADVAGWQRFRELFHPGARIGTGQPDPASVTGMDDVPVESFIETARAAGSTRRQAERSRTVHVLGDLAVVVSAFEVERTDGALGRGVHIMQLRRAPESGWLIQAVVARPGERAITEKSADPRPLSARRHDS